MYGAKYTVTVSSVSVSALQDLWEGLVPADAVVIPIEMRFGQVSDFGDAEAEIRSVTLKRITGAPTSGTGGTTPTPAKHETQFAASGMTWEANNTTQLSGGTSVSLNTYPVNFHLPEVVIPLAEGRYVFSPSERMLVTLDAAPTDAVTWTQSITYIEVGG